MSEFDFVEEPFVPSRLSPLDDEPLDPGEQFRVSEDDIEANVLPADLVLGVEPTPLGRGWAFDVSPMRAGFVTAPSGRGPLGTHGLETLKVWILKCLNTERGVFPIYSNRFGMVRPFDMLSEPSSETAIADYEDRVRDALLAHPRITGVTDFSADFDLSVDYVNVTFTVETDRLGVLEFAERVTI